MRKIVYVLFALAALSSIGCNSAKQQDPLRGYAENVRKGIPITEKTFSSTEVISRNSVIIESEPRYAEFSEGTEGKITITGRLVDLDGDFRLSIENLPSGSSFDESTGEFFWMPSRDALVGNHSFRRYDLSVWMHIETAHGKTEVQKYIPIYLTRQGINHPRIIKVDSFRGTLDTRKNHRFKIIVADEESYDGADIKFPPQIQFLTPVSTSLNGAGIIRMVTPPTQNAADPNFWTFEYEILMNQIAFSRERGWKLEIIAINRYGARSPVKRITFWTKAMNVDAHISWNTNHILKIKPGNILSHNFSIYLPKDRNGLEYKCYNLPTAMTCSCLHKKTIRPIRDKNILDCNITWTPNISQSNRTYKIKIDTTTRDDSWKLRSKNFERSIQVSK